MQVRLPVWNWSTLRRLLFFGRHGGVAFLVVTDWGSGSRGPIVRGVRLYEFENALPLAPRTSDARKLADDRGGGCQRSDRRRLSRDRARLDLPELQTWFCVQDASRGGLQPSHSRFTIVNLTVKKGEFVTKQ